MKKIQKKSFEYTHQTSENFFNSDFVNMLALTITIPTMVCLGISNYISYSQTLNDLKTRNPHYISKEINARNYTGVESLDSLINTISVKPGFNLAQIKYNSK